MLGQLTLGNLRDGGFTGVITAADTVDGLPTPPDLALITTAPDDVAPSIAALGRLGTNAAICLTPAPNLAAAAMAAQVRVIGPAAFGLMVPAIGLNATAGPMAAQPGRVALVSQSAALCRAVLDWAPPNGVGFSHIVGLGGAADMWFAITLDWWRGTRGRGPSCSTSAASAAAGPFCPPPAPPRACARLSPSVPAPVCRTRPAMPTARSTPHSAGPA